jgi:transcriptional regulator with XRE-family HTH domain
MDWRKAVKKRLKELHLTQKDLAGLLDMTERQMSNIMKGNKGTRISTLMGIAKVLDIDFDVFEDEFQAVNIDLSETLRNLRMSSQGDYNRQTIHVGETRALYKIATDRQTTEEIITLLPRLDEEQRQHILQTIKLLLKES